MDQHDLEARRILKVFGFLCVGLFTLFTTGTLVIVFSGGEVSVKNSGKSTFGTVEASIPKSEICKTEPVEEALKKTIVLPESDNTKKTLLATAKISTKPEKVQKKIAPTTLSTQKTVVQSTSGKSYKKQGKTVLNVSHKKWLIKQKWGWFLEICCREEGLPQECVDTLISLSAHESGGHPGIKNDSSSATGLFQFITSTGRSVAEELDIDPRLYNPKDPYQNIRLGVRYFSKNRKVYNSSLWGILCHYTGTYGAKDTANYYGGINNAPFVVAIKAAIGAPYEEPHQWAIAKWKAY